MTRYVQEQILRERGWIAGTVVRHIPTRKLVMIGVACRERYDSLYVMIDSRRERWRIAKIVNECEPSEPLLPCA